MLISILKTVNNLLRKIFSADSFHGDIADIFLIPITESKEFEFYDGRGTPPAMTRHQNF